MDNKIIKQNYIKYLCDFAKEDVMNCLNEDNKNKQNNNTSATKKQQINNSYYDHDIQCQNHKCKS